MPKPTKRELLRFIEWAVERAEEEESHARGMTRTFLQALADDGKKLLHSGDARKETDRG